MFVYIMASKPNGTLYVGVTKDLLKRVFEHQSGQYKGFTQKYSVKRLVYYEIIDSPYEAIKREKQLKKWRRKWKIELIENENPEWMDLYDQLLP